MCRKSVGFTSCPYSESQVVSSVHLSSAVLSESAWMVWSRSVGRYEDFGIYIIVDGSAGVSGGGESTPESPQCREVRILK